MDTPTPVLDLDYYWTNCGEFRPAICEAVYAALKANQRARELAPEPHDVVWSGGHRTAIDVHWKAHAVDVKRAFTGFIATRGGIKEWHLGFMGSSRDKEVREGVTHYALVIPVESPTLTVNSDLTVSMDASMMRFAVFEIPRDVVNTAFVRGDILSGEVGRGRNRWARLADMEQYKIADTTPPGN